MVTTFCYQAYPNSVAPNRHKRLGLIRQSVFVAPEQPVKDLNVCMCEKGRVWFAIEQYAAIFLKTYLSGQTLTIQSNDTIAH